MKWVEFAEPVKFANMAVMEPAGVKFSKAGVKPATMNRGKPAVEPATVDLAAASEIRSRESGSEK